MSVLDSRAARVAYLDRRVREYEAHKPERARALAAAASAEALAGRHFSELREVNIRKKYHLDMLEKEGDADDYSMGMSESYAHALQATLAAGEAAVAALQYRAAMEKANDQELSEFIRERNELAHLKFGNGALSGDGAR